MTPTIPPDPDFRRSVLEAALACLADRCYPSYKALRPRGASGDTDLLTRTVDALIESGELVLPEWAERSRRQSLGRREASRMARYLLGPPMGAKARRPTDEPVARAAVRDYRRAWANLRKVGRVEEAIP